MFIYTLKAQNVLLTFIRKLNIGILDWRGVHYDLCKIEFKDKINLRTKIDNNFMALLNL